jgi:WD40 repeat protein
MRLRWKVGILLGAFLLASFGAIRAYEWWTTWPARLILPTLKWTRPLAYSPDGKILATITNHLNHDLAFWDMTSGRKLASVPTPANRFRIAGVFSPDGRTFASTWLIMSNNGQNYSVDLVEVETGSVRATFDYSSVGRFLWIGYREDGAKLRLIATDAYSTVLTEDVDVATGRIQPSRKLACPISRSIHVVSKDGRFLAIATRGPAKQGPTNVTIWDLDEDREALKLPTITGRLIDQAITFSPDGRTLALGLEDGSIQLWGMSDRRLRSILPCPRVNYYPLVLTFSPDGSTLASFNLFDNRTISLDLARILIARHLKDEEHMFQSELVLLDVATGRPQIRSRWDGVTVFSPDGRSVATTQDDAGVWIHDLPGR